MFLSIAKYILIWSFCLFVLQVIKPAETKIQTPRKQPLSTHTAAIVILLLVCSLMLYQTKPVANLTQNTLREPSCCTLSAYYLPGILIAFVVCHTY